MTQWAAECLMPYHGWSRIGDPHLSMRDALDRVRKEIEWDNKELKGPGKFKYSLLDIETGQRIML